MGNDGKLEVTDQIFVVPARIAGLIIGFFVLRWALHKVIRRFAKRTGNGAVAGVLSKSKIGQGFVENTLANERRTQRAETIASLLSSVVTIVLAAVLVVMVLAELGFNILPVIASASIKGVALGFGAQTLVKDFLAGVFMIFEDQYGVGDEIDLGEAVGTVEAVSLRVTRLRDVNGTVWYVRNGEISRVGNMSQNWARTVLDISVAYHEDLVKVRRVLQEVAHDLWDDEDFKGRIIEEPSVWGVQELGFDGVIIRVALKTAPLEQWSVAREMRERIKARFDFEGIEIPYPQRVVWHRGEEPQQDGQPQDDEAGQPV
jgi:small conductance mechanosensitive channel